MMDVTEHARNNKLMLPVRYRSGEVFGNMGGLSYPKSYSPESVVPAGSEWKKYDADKLTSTSTNLNC